MTIYGSGIGPVQGVPGTLNSSGLLSNLVGGSEVHFDGVAAPIFLRAGGPGECAGAIHHRGHNPPRTWRCLYQGQTAGAADVPVAAAAPALFPTVLNPDGSLNSASNPAIQGVHTDLLRDR